MAKASKPATGQSIGRNIKVSKAAVDEAFKALSNWGKWGKHDQIFPAAGAEKGAGSKVATEGI